MKRFYKQVDITDERGILLDGKAVRTPKRGLLILPSDALANAVAEEWRAQEERVDPRSMPFTGLANAAIDIITPNLLSFAAGLAVYGESDLLTYRAIDPPDLVTRQNALWDPLLAWAGGHYNIDFTLVSGIMHRAQPSETIARLNQAVAARSAFELAALSPLVTIGGSLIVALAVVEHVIEAAPAFDLCHLDELWQAQKWGEDYFAKQTRDAHRTDFMAAARFLTLYQGSLT